MRGQLMIPVNALCQLDKINRWNGWLQNLLLLIGVSKNEQCLLAWAKKIGFVLAYLEGNCMTWVGFRSAPKKLTIYRPINDPSQAIFFGRSVPCPQTDQKWQYSKMGLKPKAISSFLGDVGLIKVVLEFSFGHPKCHFFVPENGHFWQKCPFLHA